jgi:hypothetical protein
MSKYLTDREFPGVITSELATSSDQDPNNRGRYKVLIPELMYNCFDDDGQIFCVNHVTKYRNNYCNTGEGIYGSYFPLHPGTKVIVKFHEEDLQTGYVDRIISDYHVDSLPLELETSDRDEYYQLLRTIANDLICFTCNTTTDKVPAGGFHLYHKNDNVRLIFDATGIHIYNKKDLDIQNDGDSYIKIDGKSDIIIESDSNINIKSNNNITIDGTSDITVKGNSSVSTVGNGNVTVGGNCNVLVGGICSVQATRINLNCITSATKATSNSISEKEKTKQITLDAKKDISDDFI